MEQWEESFHLPTISTGLIPDVISTSGSRLRFIYSLPSGFSVPLLCSSSSATVAFYLILLDWFSLPREKRLCLVTYSLRTGFPGALVWMLRTRPMFYVMNGTWMHLFTLPFCPRVWVDFRDTLLAPVRGLWLVRRKAVTIDKAGVFLSTQRIKCNERKSYIQCEPNRTRNILGWQFNYEQGAMLIAKYWISLLKNSVEYSIYQVMFLPIPTIIWKRNQLFFASMSWR